MKGLKDPEPGHISVYFRYITQSTDKSCKSPNFCIKVIANKSLILKVMHLADAASTGLEGARDSPSKTVAWEKNPGAESALQRFNVQQAKKYHIGHGCHEP